MRKCHVHVKTGSADGGEWLAIACFVFRLHNHRSLEIWMKDGSVIVYKIDFCFVFVLFCFGWPETLASGITSQRFPICISIGLEMDQRSLYFSHIMSTNHY